MDNDNNQGYNPDQFYDPSQINPNQNDLGQLNQGQFNQNQINQNQYNPVQNNNMNQVDYPQQGNQYMPQGDPYMQQGNQYMPQGDPYMQQGNQYMPQGDPYMQQRNQYTQQAGLYMQQGQPLPQNTDQEKKDEKTANILCLVSLACMFLVPFGTGIITGSFSEIADKTGDVSGISTLFGSLSSLSSLAAWVLMIIVRIKYRKNVFGKVLMWIYISMLALLIIAIIIFVIACASCLHDCKGF